LFILLLLLLSSSLLLLLHNEELHNLYSSPSVIRMDLREIGWDGMEWIDQAQDRDQWNLRVP
jgi:hypothetical protein